MNYPETHQIDEYYLHYLWRVRNIDLTHLRTTEGRRLEIVDWGLYNHNSGPDFLDGCVIIDDTRWRGNIELHVKSSEWYDHKHQVDPAYDNVILHVVFENDKEVSYKDGSYIPCLELRNRIRFDTYKRYRGLMDQLDAIPCSKAMHQVEEIEWTSWLDSLVVNRLKRKSERILTMLDKNKLDWEHVAFKMLAMYLGGVNREAMSNLCDRTPLNILQRGKENGTGVEAILFGQAGLLNGRFRDDYPNTLKKEYRYLKAKHKLKPMRAVEWRFGRMRPSNFPTVRIAQLASMVTHFQSLFRWIIQLDDVKNFHSTMSIISASSYWNEHYRFDKQAVTGSASLGKAKIDQLLINVVVPLQFVYASTRGVYGNGETAINLLENIRPESNKITRKWQSLGRRPIDAYQSQAYLELYKQYCQMRRCLSCRIGHSIIKTF